LKQRLDSRATPDEVLHVGEVGRPKESGARSRKDTEREAREKEKRG
jgi:hypothetical protein